MAEGEGGLGANPGTLRHRRYFGVPLRRVPDDPHRSAQAFGKPPQTSLVSCLPCPSLPLQGLLSSLLSFVKSIIKKGGKKELQWNRTKQNVTTLTWGSAPPPEPQGSRLGQDPATTLYWYICSQVQERAKEKPAP